MNSQHLLAVQTSKYQCDRDYYSPGIAPYNNIPENYYVTDYSRHQWRIVNEISVANFNLNIGLDRRWEEAVGFPGVGRLLRLGMTISL